MGKKHHRGPRGQLAGTEDLHPEMPPWEFVLFYLNIRERNFMRRILEHGDYGRALSEAGLLLPVPEFLQRPRIRAALRRCAWLAKDPVVAAKIVLPLVLQKQMEMALRDGDEKQFSAGKELVALSGSMPATRHAILKADMTRELDRGKLEEERPWVDKELPWQHRRLQPGLLPSEAVDRSPEEISRSVEEAAKGLDPAGQAS